MPQTSPAAVRPAIQATAGTAGATACPSSPLPAPNTGRKGMGPPTTGRTRTATLGSRVARPALRPVIALTAGGTPSGAETARPVTVTVAATTEAGLLVKATKDTLVEVAATGYGLDVGSGPTPTPTWCRPPPRRPRLRQRPAVPVSAVPLKEMRPCLQACWPLMAPVPSAAAARTAPATQAAAAARRTAAGASASAAVGAAAATSENTAADSLAGLATMAERAGDVAEPIETAIGRVETVRLKAVVTPSVGSGSTRQEGLATRAAAPTGRTLAWPGLAP